LQCKRNWRSEVDGTQIQVPAFDLKTAVVFDLNLFDACLPVFEFEAIVVVIADKRAASNGELKIAEDDQDRGIGQIVDHALWLEKALNFEFLLPVIMFPFHLGLFDAEQVEFNHCAG